MLNDFTQFLKTLKNIVKSCLIHRSIMDRLNRKTAIETWAQKINGGLRTNWGARRAEESPHLGNYTLTPGAATIE